MSDQKAKSNISGKVRPINFNNEQMINSDEKGTVQPKTNTVSLPPIALAKPQNIRFNSNPRNLSRDHSGSEENKSDRKFPVFGQSSSIVGGQEKFIIKKDSFQNSISKTPRSERNDLVDPVEEASNHEEDEGINDKTQVHKAQSTTKSITDILKEKDYEENSAGSEDENLDEADPKTIFKFHGSTKQFSIRSLYIFKYDHWIRLKFVSFVMHPNFDNSIIALIILNSFLLGCIDYEQVNMNVPLEQQSYMNKFVNKSDVFFVIAFGIECVSKIIGMGFIVDKGSYLRDPWNWLDFMVVISSLLTEIPAMKSFSGMRTFRLMRPLRSLTTMPSMKILISTLLQSVTQLGGVMLLTMFFFMVFAILGVSVWSGKIFYRCRMTEFPVDGNWVADPNDLDLCSEYRTCGQNRWCGSLAAAKRDPDQVRYYLDPNIDIWRDTKHNDNLNYGFSSFNHLPSAFLTIFQCVTLEGWIDICNMYSNSYSPMFVKLYFLLCIVICSLFILNLTIAVMLLKYEDIDKSTKSTDMDELYDHGKSFNLPINFVDFLIEKDGIQISQKGLKILKSQKQESFWKQLIESKITFNPDDKYYNNKLTRLFFYISNSPIFNGFIMFVISINTIVLSMNKYPNWDEDVDNAFKNMNLVFSVIFTLEVIIKLIGLGTSGFAADKMNLFDATIVVISIVEILIEHTGDVTSKGGGGGAFSALRAFRLGRIFKMFKAGDLRTLLDSIIFTIASIKDYTILLSLFIYVFALLGMSIYAGLVKFNDQGLPDPDGQSDRSNFNTVGNAILLVFEIIIGENWNSIMYQHMQTQGESAAIFFVILIILGNIIMLNLFLAILLGNFDRARSYGEKKKILEAFDSLMKMGYKINIAIAYLFDDQDLTRFIEDKILRIKDDEGQNESDKNKKTTIGEDPDYTEKEIKQVYECMLQGKIEMILSGEIQLQSVEVQDDVKMKPEQKNRSLEILAYIKRQENLKIQRQEFQSQIKRCEEVRQALDREDKEDDFLSSESEDSSEPKTVLEIVLDHIQNSSLLIFPQNSYIRNLCQKCLQVEDDDEKSAKPQDTGLDSVQRNHNDNLFSTQIPQNKIGSMDDTEQIKQEDKINIIEQQTKKRLRNVKSVGNNEKNESQLLSLNPSSKQDGEGKLGGSAKQQSLATSTMINTKTMIKKAPEKKVNLCAKLFESNILTLILISSVTLVINTPLSNPESEIILFVGYLDNCFTVLFTIEACIKIIAQGFLFNNSTLRQKGFPPYIKNPWNIIDLIVVVASLIDFIVLLQTVNQTNTLDNESDSNIASSLQSLKALRALRALRPLKMISRNPGMKLIVTALLSSLPSMTNVTIVCCLFLLIFAIMGVDLFKGQFDYCMDLEESVLSTVTNSKSCLDLGGTWYHPPENFDNTVSGFQTLFEMMSTEGWLDVMHAGIDAVPPENGYQMNPQKNKTPMMSIYFVIFMIFGSQFILNLFVGVIMDNFNKIKDKEELGSLFVTDEQRSWIDAHKLGQIQKLQKMVEPPAGWRHKFFSLVEHKIFEGTITFFIAFNTVVMAAKVEGMPGHIDEFLDSLNYMFAFIFNLEMIFKLIGLGSAYFNVSWNIFDMTVVIGTDLGIILETFTKGSGFSTAATVVRAFRIMRIVRLVRSQENIKIILDTVVNIIPQISNFISLLFLLLFIFAALGMNVFCGVLYHDLLSPQADFSNIGIAVFTLFRCSTGEDWNKIMHDLTVQENCINDQDYQTFIKNGSQPRACGSNFAIFYFLAFTIIIAWLIMNLSVAAVIEGLENAKDQNSGVIQGDHVQDLLDCWMIFDKKALGWINILEFVCMVILLPPPFGNKDLKEHCKFEPKDFQKAKNLIYNKNSYYINEEHMILIKNKDILNILQTYKIQTYQGQTDKVHFKDIYQILVKRAFSITIEDFEISKYLKTRTKNQWMEKYKDLKDIPKTGFKAHQGYASKIITGYAKNFRQRKLEKQKRLEEAAKQDEFDAADPLAVKNDLQTLQMKDNIPIVFAKEAADEAAKLHINDEKYYQKTGDGTKTAHEVELAYQSKNKLPDIRQNLPQNFNMLSNMDHNIQVLDNNRAGAAQDPLNQGLDDWYMGQQDIIAPINRRRNQDENPQEFEEVGSQEEQNQGRAIEQINMNRVAIEDANLDVSDHAESMGGDAQQLEFNVKMGQSITNSIAGQSDSNLELLSPNNDDEVCIISQSAAAQIIQAPDDEAQESRAINNRSGMNQTQNRFHPLTKEHAGVISSDGLINIQEIQPPKTADGQKRRKKRTSPSENFAAVGDGENEGAHDQQKNNFF